MRVLSLAMITNSFVRIPFVPLKTKNKQMKKRYKKILLLLSMAFVFACDTDLDKVNPNSVTLDVFYENEGDLTSAVNATYAVLQAHQLFAREWFFIHDMRGDDMASGGGHLEAPRAQLLAGTHDAANYVIGEVWEGLYGVIHRANIVLDKGPDVEMDASLRDRLLAEAKFLQAWAYNELVTLWGGVPLYEHYVTNFTDSKPRSSEAEIYAKIETNLTEAIAVLPLSYSGNDLGRATKGAARALLAKAYMHQAKYAEAKAQLQAIIESGVYELASNYNDNFMEETEYNEESVFEIGFRDSNNSTGWGSNLGDGLNQETTLRNQEYNAISWRNAVPSNGLLAEFEHSSKGDAKNDPRFEYSFYQIGDVYNQGNSILTDGEVRGNLSLLRGQEVKVSWRKHSLMYKTNSQYNPSGLNERTIRYADVLLMMAECELETQQGGDFTAAIGYLNQVRNRPGVEMPPYPTDNYPCDSYGEVFKAVVHERRVELSGEAIRDTDIMRWRKHKKINYEPLAYFVANKHELLPLPQAELDNNQMIDQSDQNPGY